jgi:inorganic pyrophosphatase
MLRAIDLTRIPPFEKGGLVNVVVETPRGKRSKLKYDDEIGVFRLRKLLPLGAAFPYDFGFVPSTTGDDGDPIDVLLLTEEPLYPGCLVAARLLGVIEARQTEKGGKPKRNDRVIAAVETPQNRPMARSLAGLGKRHVGEIEHFFVSYNEAEGKKFEVLGRGGPAKARKLLRGAAGRFAESKNGK